MSTFADFAFVIDCTSSMSSWITQCKKKIKGIVDSIGISHPHVKLRLGCVGYRDWSDAKRLEKLNFTTNVATFKDFVNKLTATGGADAAEDVLGGLQHCTTLDWSSDCRVLFHICDAPPHNKIYHDFGSDGDYWPDGYDGSKGGIADPHDYHKIVLRKFEEQRIHLCIAKLNDTVAKMIRVFKEYADLLDLTVEERELNNPSELLDNVVEVLTDAIIRVDVSDMTAHDLSEMAKVETWNPLNTTKTEFQAYVGIDFGTDGTGFAIALPSGKIIMNEKHSKDLNIKDRTNILLRPDPPHKMIAFGKAATDKYAATKDKKALYFERFKMSLYDQELTVRKPRNPTDDDEKYAYEDDEKSDTKSYLKAANGKLLETKIVFERALEHIRKLVMATLRDSDTLITKVMDVQWILTVPAIWSNYAKSIMHEATLNAGIKKKGIDDHVLIATEPECASVIARKKIDLSPGTKYILLDLGGGTADIACHRAIDENTVEQIYSPQGGPWGSSYIDEEYFKLLDKIFDKSLMDEFKKKSPNKWVRMKENFRMAKHQYDGTTPMNVTLDNAFLKYIERKYDDDSDSDSDSDSDDEDDDHIIGRKFITPFKYKGKAGQVKYDGALAITPSILIWNDLFDSVIDKLMRTTDTLLEQKEMEGCKDILLVGGLSESEYVKNKIRSKYYSESYKIHSVQKPILAVVRGAAIIGLRPSSIAKWMAPETIGIQIRRPYDETKDSILPATEKKLYKRQYVIDCGFFPLIQKGTPIDPTAAPKIEWFRPWVKSGQPQVSVKLFSSDQVDPIHTSDTPEGQKIIDLPRNWKENEAFPIVYWDKGSEKKLYIGVREWDEDDREICIQWKDPFSS